MTKEQTTTNGPLISHVSVGVNDIEKSVKFYDKVMQVLGCEKLVNYDSGAAYGRGGIPSFWVQVPIDDQPATFGNGSHVCFAASSIEMVHQFHATAIAEGGVNDGDPGPREGYSPAYYGAFARDFDGNKIEATYWDLSKLQP